MTAQFFDKQEVSNPLNGKAVFDRGELSMILACLHGRTPFFCELVGDNGYTLLLGVGDNLGAAQFSRTDGMPPYFMAVNESALLSNDFRAFLISDTATEVPIRYCLPMTDIQKIACDFAESGKRSPGVKWEEI